MGTSVIADNWSLQTIAELLVDGLTDGSVESIKFDKSAGTHSYASLPEAGISLEALFDLLTDIVLRDQLLVDEKFTSTWSPIGGGLHELVERQLILPTQFLADPTRIEGPRAEFVERLCITPSIREAHEVNAQGWNRDGVTPDPMLSAALWGGAGMLARAFVNEKGYTPHPLRRRLFQDAGIVLRVEDSPSLLAAVIREKRASLTRSSIGNDLLYGLRITLPPIPILVIREAHDVSQLLHIAMQIRDSFQGLRDWLAEFQLAITSEDFFNRESFEKILRSISTYIDSLKGSVDPNAPTFTAGVGALKVATKQNPLERLKNKFGIRANANRLILSGAGVEEFNRLLGFFGHRHSALGIKLFEHFRSRD
jgi:hypothetical protein